MTIEEYNAKMDELTERLKEAAYTKEAGYIYDEITEFQYRYMRAFVNEYYNKAKFDPIKLKIFDIFQYAVEQSESGSSIGYVNDKETADKIVEIINDKIGEFMLDSPEIYQEADGEWAISCMFGGNYVPEWDEFREVLV